MSSDLSATNAHRIDLREIVRGLRGLALGLALGTVLAALTRKSRWAGGERS